MLVKIPSVLQAYTGGRREVEADGASVDALLRALDARHPGLRFRMVNERNQLRPHMRVFVNLLPVADLASPLSSNDAVVIVQALSGG